ncbi:hypothetical protein D9M69_525590 [compost metagenome]
MRIELPFSGAIYTNGRPFQHSTDGRSADFDTRLKLSHDHRYLKVEFVCSDNFYTSENRMTRHNDPLYNQEVFEVFIGAGKEDCREYIEIEINPNSALWIGKISNPDLGESPQRILEQVNPEAAGIQYNVEVSQNAWAGFLHIPWRFIGEDAQGNYRLNFYRIRSRVPHAVTDWQCDAETCDFVCWNSTLSGTEPAFHRPRRFGYLKVVE